MSTGDERLDAVEDRIDAVEEAADRVEDNEGLGLRHRETDQHGTFRTLGRRPERGGEPEPGARRGSPGRGLGAVTAEPAVLSRARARRRRRG